MKMPKYKKTRRVKFKKCAEPGCGKDFWGHPIAKYCEKHRDIKMRVKPVKDVIAPGDINLIIEHDNKQTVKKELCCSLDGCSNVYEVILFPKQFIYPKYCPEHRNQFKRKTFIESLSGAIIN
jgi:hypothetical protein